MTTKPEGEKGAVNPVETAKRIIKEQATEKDLSGSVFAEPVLIVCHALLDRQEDWKVLAGSLEAAGKAIAQKQAEVTALRTALEHSPCPYPIGKDTTVALCIKADKCGCDNKSALSTTPPVVEAAQREDVAKALHDHAGEDWTWPEHEDDDGYRGDGAWVKPTPEFIRQRYLDTADVVLAALATPPVPDTNEKAFGSKEMWEVVQEYRRKFGPLEGVVPDTMPIVEAAWEPIETAPKDGTIISLAIAGMQDTPTNGYHRDGRWKITWVHQPFTAEPTHWMRVPKAPPGTDTFWADIARDLIAAHDKPTKDKP